MWANSSVFPGLLQATSDLCCQQWCNPLQPLGSVVSWNRELEGKHGLMGKLIDCSQRNISLLSIWGLCYLCALLVTVTTNVKSRVLDFVWFLSPFAIFTAFMYFARWSSCWLYFTPDRHCTIVLTEIETRHHIIIFCQKFLIVTTDRSVRRKKNILT